MILKTLFWSAIFCFSGIVGMANPDPDPMHISVSDNEQTEQAVIFQILEGFYQPQPTLEQIERRLLNGRSINVCNERGQTALHRCIDYFARDDIIYLCRQLLIKGARTDILAAGDLPFDRLQTPAAQFIHCPHGRDGPERELNEDYEIYLLKILIEMIYFGASYDDLFKTSNLGEITIEEIKGELIPSSFWVLDETNESLDDLFIAIETRDDRALELIDHLILADDADNPWILNGLLRLAIGRGFSQMIHPLIKKGACLTWTLSTIEGILLQENLLPEERLTYQAMHHDLMDFITQLPSCQLLSELKQACSEDDVRMFQVIKAMVPDFFADQAKSGIIHHLAHTNAYHIFKTMSSSADDVNTVSADENPLTPLQVAANAGSYEMIECLINSGADVHKNSNQPMCIIGDDKISRERMLKTLHVLLKSGVPPNAVQIEWNNFIGEREDILKMFVQSKFQEFGARIQTRQHPQFPPIITQEEVVHWPPTWRTALLRLLIGQAHFGAAFVLMGEHNPFEAWPLINSILKQPKTWPMARLLAYQNTKKLIEYPLTQGYFSQLPRELITVLLLYITHKSL